MPDEPRWSAAQLLHYPALPVYPQWTPAYLAALPDTTVAALVSGLDRWPENRRRYDAILAEQQRRTR